MNRALMWKEWREHRWKLVALMSIVIVLLVSPGAKLRLPLFVV